MRVDTKAGADTKESLDATPARGRGRIQGQVFERLRDGLMIGAFMPGQVLSLRKLAASFGTSPMPVREALTRLIVANALEGTESGSARVPRLTAARLHELFEIRERLEGMAAEGAARKSSPRAVAALERVNKDLLQAIAKRDLLGCLSLNQRFHFTLYEMAEYQLLMPLIESLWLQFGPTIYLSLLMPDMPWDASNHAATLDGMRTCDPATVRRSVIADIRATGKSLERALNSPAPMGTLASPLSDLYFGR